jgi:hypothetical protein
MPARREGLSGADLRRISISEYGMWLQSRTNKHHRPFQHDTVLACTETARVLDRWMSEQDIDGDFTACDTPLPNRFFADYITSHGQGGTNTRQRNLRHLFTWLEEAHGHPTPTPTSCTATPPSKPGHPHRRISTKPTAAAEPSPPRTQAAAAWRPEMTSCLIALAGWRRFSVTSLCSKSPL